MYHGNLSEMLGVLLVGSDSDALGGVTAALRDAGFEVTRVWEAVATLETVETVSVDCIVTTVDP